MLGRRFPIPEALQRFPFGVAGIAVILGTLALSVRVGAGNQVSFVPSKPIFDASVLLDFAEVTQEDVKLTEIGQDFATTILRSQNLFRQQVLANVPVLVSMIQTLREKRNRSMRAGFFMDLLNEYFSDNLSDSLRRLVTGAGM
jgi:hypothetical protein